MIDWLRRKGVLRGLTRSERSYQRGYDDGQKFGAAQMLLAQQDARVARERMLAVYGRSVRAELAAKRAFEALQQIKDSGSTSARHLKMLAEQASSWRLPDVKIPESSDSREEATG